MGMTVEVPELPELTFDEASHIYRLNGDIIPSVSKLMEPLKDQCYGGISKRTLENAANKGSSVHNSIENWIKFGIDDIPSEHRGYFNGFMEWWKQYKPRVFGSEVRIYHKLMRYGGTIDLLCEIGGLLELIDFKTTYSLLEMACGVQLEAYSQALISHGITPQRKHILHLKKDGKWAFREFPAKDPARCRVVGALKCLYDYENRVWQSGNINKYESSDIHSYLNNTFLKLFDSNIQGAIKQVKLPYRKNGGSGGTTQQGANGLPCKIFLLSAPEVHYEHTYPRSVVKGPSDKQTSHLHPTQKPVWLCERLVLTYTNPGEVVLDCCAGSASIGVACCRTGRRYIGIENEKQYYDVMRTRLRECCRSHSKEVG